MKNILFTIAVLAVCAVGAYFFWPGSSVPLSGLWTPTFNPGVAGPYTNDRYKFSLQVPKELARAEYDDQVNNTFAITFQDQKMEKGFQIFIVPVPGGLVTEERFMMDVPSGVREQSQDIEVAGAPGISFFSKDEILGDTAEVWFVKDEILYEVTALKKDAQWLSDILATWKFI
jgi:hypothetical protein